jgi:hypothetical protein
MDQRDHLRTPGTAPPVPAASTRMTTKPRLRKFLDALARAIVAMIVIVVAPLVAMGMAMPPVVDVVAVHPSAVALRALPLPLLLSGLLNMVHTTRALPPSNTRSTQPPSTTLRPTIPTPTPRRSRSLEGLCKTPTPEVHPTSPSMEVSRRVIFSVFSHSSSVRLRLSRGLVTLLAALPMAPINPALRTATRRIYMAHCGMI